MVYINCVEVGALFFFGEWAWRFKEQNAQNREEKEMILSRFRHTTLELYYVSLKKFLCYLKQRCLSN